MSGRPDADEERAWRLLLEIRRELLGGKAAPPLDSVAEHRLFDLYLPLLRDQENAVAHLAQSLDGRIATLGGGSQWLSGALGLRHAHRMRALFDAVIVGAETARIDDPQLTVRLVDGPNPVRIVIDPRLTLPSSLRAFTDDAAPTLVVAAATHCAGRTHLGRAEIIAVEAEEGGAIAPRKLLDVLAARGLRRVYVEGGGVTVSRFLAARCLSRLYLTIAPVILGSGRPSISLAEIVAMKQALRPRTRHVALGEDILVECSFVA